MKGPVIVTAMMAGLLSSSAAIGQTATIDPVQTPIVFREAVLGFCAEKVHGRALVPYRIDPMGSGWVDLQNPQTTGSQTIFAGRVNTATGIIIDVSPSGASCFVQINLAAPVITLATDLRDEISRQPNSVLLDEVTTVEGHGTVFGFIDPGSDEVPIFSINDSGEDGAVMTAIVAKGSKGS